MGKSLAEVHALERAHWDARVPPRFDPATPHARRASRASRPAALLAAQAAFLGSLRGRRVVEYGAGLGELSLELARRGARVTAVDLSPRSIAYLHERARAAGLADAIETHVAPAERLPFFDESFSLAIGQDVLPSVSPELGAAELHRVLQPGGRALFVQPAAPLLRRLGLRLPGSQRGQHPRALLERWGVGFAHAELCALRLPRAVSATARAGTARLPWPGLRSDVPYTAVRLIR